MIAEMCQHHTLETHILGLQIQVTCVSCGEPLVRERSLVSPPTLADIDDWFSPYRVVKVHGSTQIGSRRSSLNLPPYLNT